jgi:hypothetical protein
MQLREGSFHRPRPTCPRDPKQRVHRHGFYERYVDCDSQQHSRIKAFYFDQPDKLPTILRLHLVRDEVLAYA